MILILFLIVLVFCLLPKYKGPTILDDFISPEERQHIMKLAKERLSDSLVDIDGRIDKDIRQSQTAWLQKTDPVVRSVMVRWSR
jgi:prolyl 4-hydroxylase